MKEECFLTEEMIGPVGIPATDTNQIISIMGKLCKLSRIELLDILRKQSQVLKAEQLHTSTSEFKDKWVVLLERKGIKSERREVYKHALCQLEGHFPPEHA